MTARTKKVEIDFDAAELTLTLDDFAEKYIQPAVEELGEMMVEAMEEGRNETHH